MRTGNAIPELHTETRATGVDDRVSPQLHRVPGLTVVAHPDTSRVGDEVALPELVSGSPVRLSRLEPELAAPGEEGELRPLAEPHLSRKPLRLVPGAEPGGVTLERAGSRTRLAVEGEDVEESRSFSAAELERGVVLVLSRRVALLLHLVDPVPVSVPHFGLLGESAGILRLRQEIRIAAGLETTVLLRGETGTGKELVARALHQAGPRSGRPFVAVNMAALPPSLAAAELFGAARGAYTGAERKKAGFFQSASGGTLFLDEIGEAPPEVQALLLRALESHEVQPVGSVETKKVDVRVVAATDSDLEAAIAEGRFRAPLLHRLEGYEICLPPLRERRDDVARLLYHFLGEELGQLGAGEPWPPAQLVARLVAYDWPGNVRQLRNVARRMAMTRTAGKDHDLERVVEGLLRESDLPAPSLASRPALPTPRPATGSQPSNYRKPSEVGEQELLEALETHRWHLKPAAKALGVSRATLYRLIESSPRIRKAVDLDPEEIEEALERSGGAPDAAARALEVSPQGLKRRMRDLGLVG